MKLRFLEAGEIVTTHGVHGEVKVMPWVDTPEFLIDFKRIYIDQLEYDVESCRIQKSCNLMKLRGVTTMEQAQALRGKTIKICRDDVPSDIIFAAELIGMFVYEDNQELGKITEVLDYPGNKVYVVKGEYEYMIPAVKQFIISADLESNVMHVKTIEGMRTDEN